MLSPAVRRLRFVRLMPGLVLLGLWLATAPGLDAATFTVTNTDDSGPGSLRQAVEDANTAAGADTIDFQIASYPDAIILFTGELAVTDSVSIQGPGAANLVVSGNTSSRVFNLDGAGQLDVTISGLSIFGGSATQGAGIQNVGENLTLEGVVLSNNEATGNGSGLWAGGTAMSLTIRNSRVSGNTANGNGGGIYIQDTGGPLLIETTTVSGNLAGGNGAGLYFASPDGQITFDRTTVSGNFATGSGGGFYLSNAGVGTLTFGSSTLSGNNAADGAGAYFNAPPDGASFEHSTVAGNTASGTGGGLFAAATSIALDQTIVGDNTAATDNDLSNDASGSFDVRFSLIESPGAATINDGGGNVLNQDPQLGPLQNNGGPTETHLPANTSPAVNAGDPAFTPPPATDQRGFPRLADGRVDIGSVEISTGTLQFSSPTYSVNENGVSVTITVTRVGGSDGAVSVNYATSDGTATQPADYLPAAGTLNWADGETAPKTFQVSIVDDLLVEGDQTVSLTLSGAVGAALGSPATAVLTIVDDDLPTVNVPGIPTLGEVGKILFALLLGIGVVRTLKRRPANEPS